MGFAYAGPYRPRPAYRFTVEDSIYLHPEATGRGVGAAVAAGGARRECEALGVRQVIAVIGDSANVASIRHARDNAGSATSAPSARWAGSSTAGWTPSLMQRGLAPAAAAPELFISWTICLLARLVSVRCHCQTPASRWTVRRGQQRPRRPSTRAARRAGSAR